MELLLKDRVVLVTGGSKGIGLACAHAFLREGARIAIASRDDANLESAGAQLGKVVLIKADLSRSDDAAHMLRQAEAALGAIDVLINSAGAAKRTHLTTLMRRPGMQQWTQNILPTFMRWTSCCRRCAHASGAM